MDPLSLPLGVCEAVCDEVLVPVPVIELVAVTDSLAVEVVESVPLSVPDNDGPAPFVTDAVGEREIDLDKLIVVVGVMLDVGVPVIVPLPVGVPLELIVDDIETESEPLKLDPREGDDDGVLAMLAEILMVLDDVARGVGESEPLVLLDVEDVGTALGVILALPPKEIVDGGVSDDEGVILGVIKGVDSGVGKPLSLPEGDGVVEVEGTALDVILALPPKEIVDGGVADSDDVIL